MNTSEIESRIAALGHRAEDVEGRIDAVEKAARRVGGKHIPGDGDGDGIPYEGRNKKPGGGGAGGISAAEHAAGKAFAARNTHSGAKGMESLASRLSSSNAGHSYANVKDELDTIGGLVGSHPAAKDHMERVRTASQVARTHSAMRDNHMFTQAQRNDIADALTGKATFDSNGDLVRGGSAGRHKAGAIESYYSQHLGGKVAYQVPKSTDAAKALKGESPWTHVGAEDRNTLEAMLPGVSQFKSGGFQSANNGSEDFKDHHWSDIYNAANKAYKAGGGKGDIPQATADAIAAKHTPFTNGLNAKNSDRLDFSELGRGHFQDVMAAALAHGKLSKKPK